MADTYKRLNTTTSFTAASGGTTVAYTVPGATTALIRKIQVLNPGIASGTVKLHHVASAGSASDANVILPSVSLGVNEHGVDESPFAMATGDSIVIICDGTNPITLNIYGIEVA